MRTATIRKFGGGWNVIDAPLGLSTRYANVQKNFYRKQDGSQSLRYGTEWKVNISTQELQSIPNGTMQETVTGTEQVGDAVANAANFGFRTQLSVAGTTIKSYIEVDTVTAGSTFTCSVYDDAAGSPGSIIGSASAAVSITTPGIYEFVCDPQTTLATGTNYWFVFTDTGGTGDMLVDVVANQGGNIMSGHHDTIGSIADNQFTSSYDLKCLVTVGDALTGTVIANMTYFGTRLIVVTDEGEMISLDSSYTPAELFNEGVANSLAGAPSGWSNTFTLVTFTEISGSLIVCNGVDKPVEITEDYEVRYLQDLGTGSNGNTPIGKFCTTVGDYLVISGNSTNESTIYIGSKGTVGTFSGDPTPNDAVDVDLGAYVSGDDAVIRGLSAFQNELYVHFVNSTLRVVLGEYESSTHVPRVEDVVHDFGGIAHRTHISVVNDLLFADVSGVNSIRRNLESDATEPDRLSELIAPEYQSQLAAITGTLQDECWAVYDKLAGQYMMFMPIGGTAALRGFIFTFNERMKIRAWSEYTGWSWTCGCSSALGRVYFAKGMDVYQYGNQAYADEDYSGDYMEEYDSVWATNTAYSLNDRVLDSVGSAVYICTKAHTSGTGTFAQDVAADDDRWEAYGGDEIEFDWEFPWLDMGSRTSIKRLNNTRFDTYGTAAFDLQIFVDNVYLDENSAYDPALEMTFQAGDSPGYGGGDQPYGGGRRTADERRWAHPVKFVILKLRIKGSTNKPLRVVSVSLLYAMGRFGR